MKTISALWAAATLATTLAGAAPSQAQTVDEFYKNKTVKIIVGAATGAGYDAQARLIGRHIGKYIPGNPNVIVQNMPAGNGTAATNHIYNIALKDGTEFGLFNRNSLFAPLLGQDVAKYEVDKFNWIGTVASYQENAYVFMTRTKLGYKTFEDLRTTKTPLNVGVGSSVLVRVTGEALGANLKLIPGYLSNQLDVAFENGEVDGQGTSYANLLQFTPHWLSEKFVTIMVQYGSGKRLPALPDIPTARELARTDDDRKLIEFSEGALTTGFPMAAPPGVPAERIKALRDAFWKTMDDKDFRAEGQKEKLEFSPKTGDELQAQILGFARTPPAILERYKKLESSGK
jgi:tripartite-type tricarboxylate transporter receptor subunit TctC